MTLLAERQRQIIYVKIGLFNYCFIRVSDYMLISVMDIISRFGRVDECSSRLLVDTM